MFSKQKEIAPASKVVEELRKSNKIGSKSAANKIQEAIDALKLSDSVLYLAIQSKKKFTINGNTMLNIEIPLVNGISVKDAYIKTINELDFKVEDKNKEFLDALQKEYLTNENIDKLVKSNYLFIECGRVKLEAAVEENDKMLDFGKVQLDLSK